MPLATQNGGWARAYLALSMLPTVWEPGMHRADGGWRARRAAGTGFIPGSPRACRVDHRGALHDLSAPMAPGSFSARRRRGAGPVLAP